MKIKFGALEIELEKKPEPKPETFQERFRRESNEFHAEMDERWRRLNEK